MSSKEAANKMNDYIKDDLFNNKWSVTNSSSNSSNYDIRINFNNTNNTEFKEVIDNIPAKLFNSSLYKSDAYLVDCGSSSICDANSLNWNNSIEFSLRKSSSNSVYLSATNVSPDVYNKVIDGKAYYDITTSQKGFGGDITKTGTSNFSDSSSQDNSSVNRDVGTLTNPAIVGLNTTITLPSKNSSFWNNKTDKCYYFKVDFSEASSNDMARYRVDPIDNSYIIHWIAYGEIFGSAHRDEKDRTLFGLSKKICMLYVLIMMKVIFMVNR